MGSGIQFPFLRERFYTIRSLHDFERELSAARQKDRALSKRWRVPDAGIRNWAKLREETYPLKLFADHTQISDDCEFCLMPEGHPDDVELRADQPKRLQITVADPMQVGSRNGGYDHRLLMEALNRYDTVSGSGPFCRIEGEIRSMRSVMPAEEDFSSCVRGLQAALSRKIDHDGRNSELLVYARSFHMTAIDSRLSKIVDAAIEKTGRPRFQRIYIFDQNEGAFLER